MQNRSESRLGRCSLGHRYHGHDLVDDALVDAVVDPAADADGGRSLRRVDAAAALTELQSQYADGADPVAVWLFGGIGGLFLVLGLVGVIGMTVFRRGM